MSPSDADNARPMTFPSVHHDPDGDMLEVLLSNEAYKGRDVGKGITLYHARSSGAVVGFCISPLTGHLFAQR